MNGVWGEFIDPKEMERRLRFLIEEVASLRLEVDGMKRKQDETALLNTAPIGVYVPRNRRV